MATSGTYTYNMTASKFLDSVLMLSGIVGEGETASAAQYDLAFESLNLQQHQLEVNDLPLWKRDFYEFKPQQSSYVTNNSVDYRCVKGNTAAANTEPGVGDLWEGYWVADVDPEGTPTAWSLTTVYTTSIEFSVPDRFYDILIATTLQNSSNEVDVDIVPFDSYTQYQNSKRTSLVSTIPLMIAFDNKLTNTGYIYPQPTNSFDSTMRIYGIVKPEDVDANSQSLDIPPRYLNMLRFNVALDLAYQYQREGETIQLLMRQASYYTDQYKKSNIEHTSSNIVNGAY